jgi:hypothetical protein
MAQPIAPHSGLPTFIMPCPQCRQRMSMKSVSPSLYAPELEDITHACDNCGSELVRTVKAGKPRTAPSPTPDRTRAA